MQGDSTWCHPVQVLRPLPHHLAALRGPMRLQNIQDLAGLLNSHDTFPRLQTGVRHRCPGNFEHRRQQTIARHFEQHQRHHIRHVHHAVDDFLFVEGPEIREDPEQHIAVDERRTPVRIREESHTVGTVLHTHIHAADRGHSVRCYNVAALLGIVSNQFRLQDLHKQVVAEHQFRFLRNVFLRVWYPDGVVRMLRKTDVELLEIFTSPPHARNRRDQQRVRVLG